MKLKIDLQSLLWFLVFPYVLVDSISGFFVQQLMIDPKLSQVLKIILFVYFMVYILKKDLYVFLCCFFLLAVLLINPVRMIFTYNSFNALSYDFPGALRVFMIFLSTVFFYYLAKEDPYRFLHNAKLLFIFSFVVVSLNILLGYLGFGFYTYPDSNFGYKGFFFAGNELSALFILFSSFILFELWKRYNFSFIYIIVSIFIIWIGFSIGTKTGGIFSFLAVFFIPLSILSANRSIFSISIYFLLIFMAIALLSIFMFPLIADSFIIDRILHVFNTKGVISVIFSGRENFLLGFLDRIHDQQGFFPLLFGFGSGTSLYQFKTIEIDFFDLFMYFGLPVSIFYLIFSLVLVFVPLYLIKTHYYAPLLFVINFTFVILSFTSGHIWTSGMLGIGWGVMNSLIIFKYIK